MIYEPERELVEVLDRLRREDPKLIEQVIAFGKNLITFSDQCVSGRLTMHFHNGSIKQRELSVFEKV